MRVARISMPVLIALAAAACARQQQAYYAIDPATGQPVPVVQQYSDSAYQQAYAQQSQGSDNSRGLFSSPQAAQQAYAQQPQAPAQYAQGSSDSRRLFSLPPAAQQAYAQQTQAPPQYAQSSDNTRGLFSSPQAAQQAYAPPQVAAQTYPQSYAQPLYGPSTGRGLFNARHTPAPAQYAQPTPQQSYVLQYHPPPAAGGPYAAPPHGYGYAYAPSNNQQGYTFDAGDKLRVVVFGQQGISGSYLVDAGGNVSLPLVGTVTARGFTTQQLAKQITARLKQGYVREPHVTVTIETYRPFFILGEVTTPGQYPYVPNMTVENAIAVAGGFAPRAKKGKVELTRNTTTQQFKGEVPLNYPMRPGDTIVVKERWF